MPERVRLQRTKGWRMPPNTVKVDRTTRWGNPFKVGDRIERYSPGWEYVVAVLPDGATRWFTAITLHDPKLVVEAHMAWFIEQPHLMLTVEEELRGVNLACWCREDQPCHADNLLFMANPLPEDDHAH